MRFRLLTAMAPLKYKMKKIERKEMDDDDKDLINRCIRTPSIPYRHYMLNRGFRYLMISGDPWFFPAGSLIFLEARYEV